MTVMTSRMTVTNMLGLSSLLLSVCRDFLSKYGFDGVRDVAVAVGTSVAVGFTFLSSAWDGLVVGLVIGFVCPGFSE